MSEVGGQDAAGRPAGGLASADPGQGGPPRAEPGAVAVDRPEGGPPRAPREVADAAGARPVDVGLVTLRVPAAWTEQPPAAGEPRRAWTLPPSSAGGPPGGVVVLQPLGALPAGGPSLEARLAAAAGAFGRSLGAAPAGPVRRGVLGTVPALVAPLRGGLGAALFVAGEAVLLLAAWSGEAGFQALNALSSTLRPRLPRVDPPDLGPTVAATVLGAALEVPAAWTTLPGAPAPAPHQAAWQAPQRLLGAAAAAPFPVLVEAQPECPLSLRLALLRFARAALPALGCAAELAAGEPRVAGQLELTLPDGTPAVTLVLEAGPAAAPEVRCVAHARGTARGALLGATAMGPWAPAWRGLPEGVAPARLWERLDDAAEAVLAVLARGRPQPLPPEAPEVAAQLLARGRWARRREWSDASSMPSMSGVGTFSTYSSGHEAETWTFRADGVCVLEHDEDSSFSAYDAYAAPTDGRFQTDWVAAALPEESRARRERRWEVRGPHAPGGPHLLVLRDPAGAVTVHTLELARTVRVGRRDVTGLAIDGRVEGLFRSSSSGRVELETWSPL